MIGCVDTCAQKHGMKYFYLHECRHGLEKDKTSFWWCNSPKGAIFQKGKNFWQYLDKYYDD